MRLPRKRSAVTIAAGALVVMLGALIFTGKPATLGNLVRFAPKGLVPVAPQAITHVEIRAGRDRFVFDRRGDGSWADADAAGENGLSVEFGSHLDAGLRFMNVSEPMRSLDPAEFPTTGIVEFGLDPPASVVVMSGAGKVVATAQFGAPNPAGTSQYVRLLGSPRVHLMPRHVGAEWQVATDMARRLAAQAPRNPGAAGERANQGFLLPASIEQIWAVELVTGGKLQRFERDGAGSWFLHTGQHSHADNANAHVADPAQARLIGTALEVLDRSEIEAMVARRPDRSDLSRYGLAFPPLIVLVYPRDSSTPLARIEVGDAAGDGFSRYALLAKDGDVVRIADYEVRRLTDLLKALGAGS